MLANFILAAAAVVSSAAQPRANVQLPIAPGYYIWEEESCARPGSVFRYDGRRAGWFGQEPGEGDMVGRIRRVWREGRRWVVQVTGRDAHGDVQDGLIEYYVTMLGRGRISADLLDGEEIPLKRCEASSLPRWGRRF
jgi:hypothetical protein